MIRTQSSIPAALTFAAVWVLVTISGCADTKPSDTSAVTASSHQLQVTHNSRPPLDQYLRARERERTQRAAPPRPKTTAAAEKLALFERRVSERQAAWADLSPGEREHQRALLKNEILADAPAARGGN